MDLNMEAFLDASPSHSGAGQVRCQLAVVIVECDPLSLLSSLGPMQTWAQQGKCGECLQAKVQGSHSITELRRAASHPRMGID